ncbi:MAG: hypothetical protein JNL96_24630 [Planctomycetaceae bacterium]|nr:hypothetical protein [Planctomycetaceae bacterium]
MFIAVFILCALVIVGAAVARGPREAAALALATSMLVPNWLLRELGATLIDMRIACALLAVGCVALHPQTRWKLRPNLADFLVVALVVSQIVTELSTSEPFATALIDIAVQWLAPYALGRLAWRSFADGERLLPLLAGCCLVLGAWSAFESITRINPVQIALGYAGSLQGLTDIRWGMKRADGPLMHPIFFGLQMVVLYPFALAASRRAREGLGPKWWRFAPWAAAAGAFFTMSRGPQIGIAATLLTTTAILSPRLRWPILVPAILAAGLLWSGRDAVIDLLHHWSGERPTTAIEIRGEWVPYSGTTHRILQVRVYEEALAHAGWSGYGTAALVGTTQKIPYVEEHLRQMFASIDNHYLQFTLLYGYAGLALFLGLCLLGAWYASTLLRSDDGGFRALGAATFGALVVLTVLFGTVWLAADIRFPLMALVGAAGGMAASRKPADEPSAWTKSVPRLAPLRLVPGHPAFHTT